MIEEFHFKLIRILGQMFFVLSFIITLSPSIENDYFRFFLVFYLLLHAQVLLTFFFFFKKPSLIIYEDRIEFYQYCSISKTTVFWDEIVRVKVLKNRIKIKTKKLSFWEYENVIFFNFYLNGFKVKESFVKYILSKDIKHNQFLTIK